MNEVTKFNVYDEGGLVASYDSQAPATSWAVQHSKLRYGKPSRSLTVVEETYTIVGSRPVRDVINGVITKCS